MKKEFEERIKKAMRDNPGLSPELICEILEHKQEMDSFNPYQLITELEDQITRYLSEIECGNPPEISNALHKLLQIIENAPCRAYRFSESE